MMLPTWNSSSSCCMTAIKSVHLAESLMLLAVLPLYAVFMRILHDTTALPGNVKFGLAVLSSLNIALLLVRIVDFADFSGHYDFGPTLQNSIKMICFSMGMFSVCNLLAERVYEDFARKWHNRPRFSRYQPLIIVIFATQLICVLIAYRLAQNGRMLEPRRFVIVLLSAAILALAASLVVFMRAGLQQLFMRKDRSALLYHPASSQARIVKTQLCDRIISLYVPYQVLSMLLTTSLGAFLVLQVQRNYPDHFLFFQSLIYLSITPRTMLSLLLPLFFHPALYNSLRQCFGWERSSDERHGSLRVQLSTCDDQPKYIIVRTNEQCPTPGQDIELRLVNDSARGYTALWNRMSR